MTLSNVISASREHPTAGGASWSMPREFRQAPGADLEEYLFKLQQLEDDSKYEVNQGSHRFTIGKYLPGYE